MKKSQILVIEDESKVASLIQDALKLEGYQVRVVTEGEKGLEIIARKQPDLVVLDVMLPGIDGWQVLEEIRSNPATSCLPVIVLTAKSHSKSKVFGLKHGADDYVTKPFDPLELAARIEAVLKRSQSVLNKQEKAEGVEFGKVPILIGKKILLLEPEEINYIKSIKNYTSIHAGTDSFLSNYTLNELEHQLKPQLFFRTHRSYLVNLRKVKEIVPFSKSTYHLVLSDVKETRVPLSRLQAKEFKKLSSFKLF